MEMRKCTNGHYYDASVHSECPYCNRGSSESVRLAEIGGDNDRTMPLSAFGMSDDDKTMPLLSYVDRDDDKTMPLTGVTDRDEDKTIPKTIYQADCIERPPVRPQVTPPLEKPFYTDTDKTMVLIDLEKGIDPVVGWLVNVDGEEKGMDYRIHMDNNFIGRSEKMDICIKGDETISRENHAVISYDPKDSLFYFTPSDGRAISRLNDKAVFQTIELHAHDRITIGKTVCEFIPFCDGSFQW